MVVLFVYWLMVSFLLQSSYGRWSCWLIFAGKPSGAGESFEVLPCELGGHWYSLSLCETYARSVQGDDFGRILSFLFFFVWQSCFSWFWYRATLFWSVSLYGCTCVFAGVCGIFGLFVDLWWFLLVVERLKRVADSCCKKVKKRSIKEPLYSYIPPDIYNYSPGPSWLGLILKSLLFCNSQQTNPSFKNHLVLCHKPTRCFLGLFENNCSQHHQGSCASFAGFISKTSKKASYLENRCF